MNLKRRGCGKSTGASGDASVATTPAAVTTASTVAAASITAAVASAGIAAAAVIPGMAMTAEPAVVAFAAASELDEPS